jgi:hypothetical protein
MLRRNLVAARNLRNDSPRNERLRDNLRLLRVAPAPPSAMGENLDAQGAAVLHHIVHHIFQN